MSRDFGDRDFCAHSLKFYPLSFAFTNSSNDIGIFMLVIGIVYILMSFITILWIKIQECRARKGTSNSSAKSVIFPVFVNFLWFSAFTSVYSGVIVVFVPVNPTGTNTWTVALAYGLRRGFQHCVTEGIAFMLLQNGLGINTAKKVLVWSLIWSAITFVVTFLSIYGASITTLTLEVMYDFVLLAFYIVLWLAPEKKISRRPAAIRYAQLWSFYRVMVLITNCLAFSPHTTSISSCMYVFVTLMVFAVFEPLICYHTLLQDSLWWQGLHTRHAVEGSRFPILTMILNFNIYSHPNKSNTKVNVEENVRFPLLGTDFSLESAQHLANTLDKFKGDEVQMLNFAKIDFGGTLLGSGSFSRVMTGSYCNVQCAIKVIYSPDLTPHDITKLAAEASILSSINNTNVVNILGVSVYPPSLCLLLELCTFGSLSDMIRGYGFAWNADLKAPISISLADRTYLALGCARGLEAVHSFSRGMCHRDVKSFNFLVDYQLNAKIADLELGLPSGGQIINVEEVLINWMAPEIVLGQKPYEQSSDVYSIGLVFWEIISCAFPFDGFGRDAVKDKLTDGFRHPMPLEFQGSAFAGLIERCWSQHPGDRPSIQEVVSELEVICHLCCYALVSTAQAEYDVSPLVAVHKLNEEQDQQFEQDGEESLYCTSSDEEGEEKEGDNTVEVSDPNTQSDVPVSISIHARVSSPSKRRKRKEYRALKQQQPAHANAGGTVSSCMSCLHKVFSTANASILEKRKTGKKKSLPKLPKQIAAMLVKIYNDLNWLPFEESLQPWAVFSSSAPHILLYSTTHWNFLFGIERSQLFENKLYSLIDLAKQYASPSLEGNNNNTNGYTSARASPIINTDSLAASTVGTNRDSRKSLGSERGSLLSFLSANASGKGGRSSKFVVPIDDEVYSKALDLFLQQLQQVPMYSAHGVVPMAKRVSLSVPYSKNSTTMSPSNASISTSASLEDTVLQYFLCSLHAFPIYLDETATRIRQHSDVKPMPSMSIPKPTYIAILFNEFQYTPPRNTNSEGSFGLGLSY